MARFRDDEGFGLIELLVAITIMNVGVLAVVAAFTSGTFAINRASQTATATSLADARMETYRAMTAPDIGLDANLIPSLDSTYTSDEACWDPTADASCSTTPNANLGLTEPTASGGSSACTQIEAWYGNEPCHPTEDLTGAASPDGHGYRIDTYVFLLQPVIADSTATPPVLAHAARKQVTVVVRDLDTSKVLVRETSVFDCTTAGGDSTTCE